MVLSPIAALVLANLRFHPQCYFMGSWQKLKAWECSSEQWNYSHDELSIVTTAAGSHAADLRTVMGDRFKPMLRVTFAVSKHEPRYLWSSEMQHFGNSTGRFKTANITTRYCVTTTSITPSIIFYLSFF